MPPDRSPIQKKFIELFEPHDLKIPGDHLRDGTPGSLPYGSGRLMFAFGMDDGAFFMEYYAHHRIGGDCRGRIYEDGRHVPLPELCTMICYNADIPGDYERQEKENREEYERIMKELIEVGIFSGGPASPPSNDPSPPKLTYTYKRIYNYDLPSPRPPSPDRTLFCCGLRL